MTLTNKTALVIGASGSVGRATVNALLAGGANVTAVARGADGLASLRAANPALRTLPGDAADPIVVTKLFAEVRPDLVVLAAGVIPPTRPFDEQSWDEFSSVWNADMAAAFHIAKAAITTPLAPGSTVVIVSSGAAIVGSPLSGGYAGAKRMQWLLAGYAQQRADRQQLGLRFLAVVPGQLIEDTRIGLAAATAYGATLGLSPAAYMKRFDVPLDATKVASAILSGLRGEIAPGVTAIKVTGTGHAPL